jgi:hypothetical protein
MRPLTRVRGGWLSAGALQDAWDVEGQGAVRVDRFELAGAEMSDRFVADGVPVGALSLDGVLEVSGGREDAGVDDERVAVRLGRLVFVVGVADGPAVGEEDEAA